MKFSPAVLYDYYRRGLRHPRYRWVIIGATLVYLASPIDLLPEALLPVVGALDDVALVTLLLTELSQVTMEWLRSRRGRSTNAVPMDEPRGPVVDVDAGPPR